MSGRASLSTPVFPAGSGLPIKIGDFVHNGTFLSIASIPQTFSHLRIIGQMQGSRAVPTGATGGSLRINGVSSTSYGTFVDQLNSDLTRANQWTDLDRIFIGNVTTAGRNGAYQFGVFDLMLPFYARSDNWKSVKGENFLHGGNVAANTQIGGVAYSTAPVTSLRLADDVDSVLTAASVASLYGIY